MAKTTIYKSTKGAEVTIPVRVINPRGKSVPLLCRFRQSFFYLTETHPYKKEIEERFAQIPFIIKGGEDVTNKKLASPKDTGKIKGGKMPKAEAKDFENETDL